MSNFEPYNKEGLAKPYFDEDEDENSSENDEDTDSSSGEEEPEEPEQTNGSSKQESLGRAAADAAQAVRLAKSSANGSAPRIVNGTEKVTTNGKALSPYSRSVAVPSLTGKASANMEARLIELDLNVVPDEDGIFKKRVELVWSGQGKGVLGNQIFHTRELEQIFSVVPLNIDKHLESQMYYGQASLKDFFLNKLAVVESFSSVPSILFVTVASQNPSQNDELQYLNNKTIMHGKSLHRGLVSIPPNNTNYGEHGNVLVDNTKVMGSRTYQTFGHIDLQRILDLVREHAPASTEEDQRLRFPKDNAIGQMILNEENKKMLEEGNDEQGGITTEGNMIRIGPKTFARAVNLFFTKVKPMIRGKHDLIEHKGLVFHLHEIDPTGPHLHDRSNYMVSITFEFTYTFSKGTRDGMEEKKRQKHKVQESPTEAFARHFDAFANNKTPSEEKKHTEHTGHTGHTHTHRRKIQSVN